MTQIALDPLDLAALLCSRVCHDVISPVGAIVNGLEILEDEKDADMRAEALQLIRASAENASARLQFCRLAFGAAGSAGASIDTGDAEKVARGLFPDAKIRLDWRAPRVLLPKNKVKLILNLCLIAAAAIPRGGVITVETPTLPAGAGDDGATEPSIAIRVTAQGQNAKLAPLTAAILAGAPTEAIDAHAIQPYYAALVAQAAGMRLNAETAADFVAIEATPTAPARSEAA
ncbi:histidine phosphotransferase ChpT [Methylocella silvestris]|uniref:Histidine phosphotransferase n=1 Tax=Methylocella silvestris TaxID=199596 RepID=A0A2J7TF38_METSI|nr:histidine phosphotransferase family protein [Methylocella silvestris]PNG25391.1 histidine phosphotransferase [Methylocella silvestris]